MRSLRPGTTARRQLCALLLGAALVLAGCATRVPWGQLDLPESLRGTVEPGDGTPGSMRIATTIRERSARGIGVVPFHLNNARQLVLSIEAIGPFGTAPVTFDARLDTGSPNALTLPRSVAKRVGPWLEQGPPRSVALLFGETPVYAGALLQLRMGTITAGPIAISMDGSQRDYEPVIGLPFLRNFQCVIVDWQREELLLVTERNNAELQRRYPTGAYEWTEVPLVRIEGVVENTVFSDDDVAPQHPDNAASSNYVLDLIGVAASIGDESMAAIIDTGGSGEILAFRDLPTVPGTDETIEASSGGHAGQLERATLALPLQIGPLRFDTVKVHRIRGDNRMHLPDGLPDLALGNTLLRRHTLWIDFERHVIRFGRFVDDGD